MRAKFLTRGLLIPILLALSACGGSGGGSSNNDSSNVSERPKALAGNDITISLNELVTLTGNGQNAKGGVLSYQWTLVSKPQNSSAEIDNPSQKDATFTPDFIGKYEIALTVVESGVSSSQDLLTVSVNPKVLDAQFVHISALTNMKYSLAAAPEDYKYSETQFGKFECFEHEDIHLFIGDTKIGNHSCAELISIDGLHNEGKPLTENAKLNISWLLQIIEWDQRFDEIFPNFSFVESQVFNFDVQHELFISKNNLRQLVLENLDNYQTLDFAFAKWEQLSIDARVDLIIGDIEYAKKIYNSFTKNFGKTTQIELSQVKEGFPVRIPAIDASVCTYKGGSHISVLVADLNQNNKAEIVANNYPCGGFNIIDSKGNELSSILLPKVEHPTLLATGFDAPHIATGYAIYDQHLQEATRLDHKNLGWASYPPAISDLDEDGQPEVIIPFNYNNLKVFQRDGGLSKEIKCDFLETYCSQELVTPTIGDFDNDDEIEFVTFSKSVQEGLYVFEADGSLKSGFPVDNYTTNGNFPIVADVDNDGAFEIVSLADHFHGPEIRVFSFSGEEKYAVASPKLLEMGEGVLSVADLNGNGTPEIIHKTDTYLNVYQFKDNKFESLDGWPQRLNFQAGFSGGGKSQPVVGDVDGDNKPDIIVYFIKDKEFNLLAYNAVGELLDGFPKAINELEEKGIYPTPAIADIDNNGTNEIIVAGRSNNFSPIVYAFELNKKKHGNILWGQFAKNAKHSNFVPLSN